MGDELEKAIRWGRGEAAEKVALLVLVKELVQKIEGVGKLWDLRVIQRCQEDLDEGSLEKGDLLVTRQQDFKNLEDLLHQADGAGGQKVAKLVAALV